MSGETAIWVDGKAARVLPLPDRGLDFGDGLFETLLLSRGIPMYPELHLERLRLGLVMLRFPDCMERVQSYVRSAADEIRLAGWPWCAMRLTVTRGSGPRGYTPPARTHPRVIVQAVALTRDCATSAPAARLVTADIRLPRQPALARIKHLNRLEQVLAAQEGAARGADEVLLLDVDGEMVSVAAGNLFLVCRDELLTPSLEDRGVCGTRRRLIMERWAPAAGISVRECSLDRSDLSRASEVFYSNALFGLRAVRELDDFSWRDHKVCDELFSRFLQDLP